MGYTVSACIGNVCKSRLLCDEGVWQFQLLCFLFAERMMWWKRITTCIPKYLPWRPVRPNTTFGFLCEASFGVSAAFCFFASSGCACVLGQRMVDVCEES